MALRSYMAPASIIIPGMTDFIIHVPGPGVSRWVIIPGPGGAWDLVMDWVGSITDMGSAPGLVGAAVGEVGVAGGAPMFIVLPMHGTATATMVIMATTSIVIRMSMPTITGRISIPAGQA